MNPSDSRLEELAQEVWQRLADGVHQRRHPFRYGTLATQTVMGPALRMVVLRQVQPPTRTLVFYTDRRSAKVGELIACPTVGWLFYDEADQIQVRLNATAHLLTDEGLIHAAWESLRPEQRRDYGTRLPPAAPVLEPATVQPGQSLDEAVATEKLMGARKNFAVVLSQVHAVDWLQLGRHAHERAWLTYTAQGTRAQWVVP